ncbi:MAG TPA: twin-arginine translocase subunit TatC [Acidimicrobiales bacterium]|jgi:sec-independent protein translocase protein TatC|nr:twin-arginine translocase subunit TatC [Acidimicrobiales bacterium]
MRLPWRRGERRKLATSAEHMTLVEHLTELRFRLIRALLAIVLGAVLVFVFYEPILDFLRRPYDEVCAANPEFNCTGEGFLFTTPLQGFSTRLRVSGYGGFILALPVVLWQIWRFIVPGLEDREKKYARPFLVSTVVFFLFGASLAYLTTEKALQWLISYGGDGTAAFTPDGYMSFLALMLGGFGVGFLFPVLLVFLQLAGVFDHRQLASFRRYAVVLCMVAAAVITPGGDPISLFALFVPMYLFYELSVIAGWLISRRRAKAGELAAGAA